MAETVLLEVKPTYKSVERLGNALALGSVITWGFGVIAAAAISTFLSAEPLIVACVATYFVCFVASLILLLWLDKKNFEATTYKVYADRIEFEEGFINHKYTVINMQDIKEIHLTQNFVQRWVGLGTIRFVTAANVTEGMSGVRFRCIENSKDIYTKVKQIQEGKK